MNFYKHHLGDYARDTAHLSLVEHGAYLLLLHHHYATEAPLPADKAVVCRIVRATTKAEVAAIDAVLREFWTLTDAGWVNGRASEELLAASALRDLNREKGKLGGRPAKAEENPPAFSRLSPGEPDGIADGLTEQKPSQTPDTRHQKRRGDNPPLPPAAAPPVVLPPGLAPETWKAFKAHRQRLRAPLTRHAEELLIRKLAGFCTDGADPNAVVELAIERGWKGLFPVNGSRSDASAGIRQWLKQSADIEGECTHDA